MDTISFNRKVLEPLMFHEGTLEEFDFLVSVYERVDMTPSQQFEFGEVANTSRNEVQFREFHKNMEKEYDTSNEASE